MDQGATGRISGLSWEAEMNKWVLLFILGFVAFQMLGLEWAIEGYSSMLSWSASMALGVLAWIFWKEKS